MGEAWKFEAGGVTLAGGKRFLFAGTPSIDELRQVAPEFRDLVMAREVLRRAAAAFETGGAIYRDALRNLLDLSEESRKVSGLLAGYYADLSTFFEGGKGPFEAIAPDQRVAFAGDLIEALHREATRKAEPVEPKEAEAAAKA